jgi:BirA family biotin operon repressor/biotin-[acetyl-CoA-carboxylase] ligase
MILFIGHTILRFSEVTSTSDLARDYIRQGPCHRLVLRADHQTAGHGRFGRRWEAEPGGALLTSVILWKDQVPAGGRALTAVGALAVAEAVNDLLSGIEGRGRLRVEPHRAEIHWPNDVYLLGRKLAGVLVEEASGPAGSAWIVGIGVNVRKTPMDLASAISLQEAAGVPLEVDSVAEGVYGRLEQWMARLGRSGVQGLAATWRQVSGLMSRQVRMECDGQLMIGRVIDVHPEAGLTVVAVDGRTLTLEPERITGVEIVG